MTKYNIFSYLFVLAALCIALSSSADFFGLEEWEHEVTKQKLFCLEDVHRAGSQDQQDDLLWVAKQLDACVIAEDALSYEGNNAIIKKYCASFESIFQPSPLVYLIKKCKKAHMRCENVEYRFAQIILESTLHVYGIEKLKAIVGDLEKFKQYVQQEEQASIKEIKSYQYQDPYFQELHTHLLGRALKRAGNYPIDELLKASDPAKFMEIVEKNMFDAAGFLDLRILRQLYVYRKSKHLIIAAGAAHINGLLRFLPMLGYHKVNRVGKSVEALSDFDIKKMELYEKLGCASLDIGKYFNEHPILHLPKSPVQKGKEACLDKLKGSLIMTGLLGLTGALVYYMASS